MSLATVVYREVSIHFSETEDAWYFNNGQKDEYFHGLKPAKAAIDKLTRRKYVPIEVFCIEDRSYARDGAPAVVPGRVTRPGQGGGSYRFVPDHAEGDKVTWEQQYRPNLFLRTPENQEIIQQYVEARKAERAAKIRGNELRAKLQTVPAEMEVVP